LGRNLTNVAVVVTRYFGGILLGTGGLVRAYQKATVEGLDNSVIAEKKYGLSFNIKSDYNGFSKIQRIATNENINIMDVDYTENVDISFVCEEEIIEDFIKKIVEATAGKAEISERKKVQFYSTNKGIQLIE
jgi:putative IMPACT (imprinted ancient) family translation regulator